MSSGKLQGIRETIQLFANTLASCGVPKIPSESFRQAKFNKPEATKTFWSLLFNVVQILNFVDGGGGGEISAELSFQSVISDEDRRLISYTVRRHFYRAGYFRPGFYGDFEIGSRELLLALAWLIHESELFTKLRVHQLRLAGEVTVPLRHGRRLLVGEMCREAEETGNEIGLTLRELEVCKDSEALHENLQELTWLKGKLQKSWKSMLNSHLAYQKMADSLHKCTIRTPQHTSSPHLAVHELFLLRFPEQLSAYLKKLECHISVLQNLLSWEYHQPLFWQWMESVLDLSDKERAEAVECESSTDDGQSESGVVTTRGECATLSFEVLTRDVKRLERDVAKLLDKNKPHVDRLSQIWAVKKRHINSKDLEIEMDRLTKNLQCLSLSLSSEAGGGHMTTHAPIAAVQVLGVTDVAVYLPEQTTQLERLPKSMATSVVSQQQEVNALLLQVSKSEVAQMHAAVARLEEVIQSLTAEIGRQLTAMQEMLPPSIYTVDSSVCTPHHSSIL